MVKIMDSAALRQELVRIMKEKGLTQDQVGRAIDRSGSLISQYLKGAYSHNLGELETLIRGFVEKALGRETVIPRTAPFVETRVAKIFHEIAYQAHLENELAVLIADAGMGKTTAAEEYARRNPEVLLVPANMSYTARVLFLKLCELLDLPQEGNLNELVSMVVKKLLGSGRLLLVDQAEYLPDRALELLRTVYDDAKVGILLFGMPRLEQNLRRSKGSHAQLYSRVGLFQHIRNRDAQGHPNLTRKDVAGILTSRLGAAVALETFDELCRGNARTLDKLIRRARAIARTNQTDITDDVVREAHGMLMG